ncbi:MAG: glycoside hydrolase family 66 protein [Anaerolineaceae bacterium]|nr:glycoside hydrolase family 66 protein [Anaerolineaceae bacterium]
MELSKDRGRVVFILAFLLLIGQVFTACYALPSESAGSVAASQDFSSKDYAMHEIKIETIHYGKAYYQPGELAFWQLDTDCPACSGSVYLLSFEVMDGFQVIAHEETEITLNQGKQFIEVHWRTPQSAPKGYLIKTQISGKDGALLCEHFGSLSVLNNWTEMPLYGFLSDYEPGRKQMAEDMQALADFHINGLQFYDWMYRHEQLLTEDEPYKDILGRRLSRRTVEGLIDAAHEKGMAAMPYSAIYGASIDFYKQHPDWAMFRQNGKPVLFGDNFMAVMDPRPESPWTRHLLNEFKIVLTETQFDGIHLDQYGDPKEGFSEDGQAYDLPKALAGSINATKKIVEAYRPGGAVVFNAVTAWPLKEAVHSQASFIYIEVWPPYDSYNDLARVIEEAQKEGTNKAVVIAAYVHTENNAAPLLTDAIVFASGATRIELGEKLAYLADPYFPKYEALSSEQKAGLRRYYDFIVAYQALLGPQAKNATAEWLARIKADGLSTSLYASVDKLLPIVRETERATTISLVNLYGIGSEQWQKTANTPELKKELTLRIALKGKIPHAVWAASPDENDWTFGHAEYSVEGDSLVVHLKQIQTWSLLSIEWKE